MAAAEDRTSVLGFFMACEGSSATAPRSTAIVIALCLLASATGYIAAFSAPPTKTAADKTLTDTLGVLDRAIHLLGDPSSNYRKVLLDAIAAFPSNADDNVRTDLRAFLTRAPQPGGDFRCSVDFVRSRA